MGRTAISASPEPARVPGGASVTVCNGFYAGLEVPIDACWLVVGRGRGADVVLSEPTLSRAHAALGFDEDGFFVQDLGSTNETRVNERHVDRCVLQDGDTVQWGRLQVEVRLPSIAIRAAREG